MQLNVREVAGLLDVSEKTIYRWIKQSKLPAFKINEQYRFSRAEVLEWATSQRINVSPEIFGEPRASETPMPSLEEALKAGGIHYRVGGTDRNSVLQATVDLMPLPEEVDRSFLLRVLIARETLGSTGIGNGLAVPHVRNPIVLHVPRPLIALCFLEREIPFGALDGHPVHTIFAIVSPTISAHLHLLSRLSFALLQTPFADVIARRGTRDEILESAAQLDRSLPRPVLVAAGKGVART